MSAEERRSFRADTLEEALRLVSDELGPEALVVRQREGVIGGIGGFFGRRCVELEVELPVVPASVSEAVAAAEVRPRSLAIPRGAVLDRYDSGPSVRTVDFLPFVPDESVAAEAQPDWLEPEAPTRAAAPESSFDWIEPETPARPAVREAAAPSQPDEAAAVPEPAIVAAVPEEPATPTEPAEAAAPETPAAADEPVTA